MRACKVQVYLYLGMAFLFPCCAEISLEGDESEKEVESKEKDTATDTDSDSDLVGDEADSQLVDAAGTEGASGEDDSTEGGAGDTSDSDGTQDNDGSAGNIGEIDAGGNGNSVDDGTIDRDTGDSGDVVDDSASDRDTSDNGDVVDDSTSDRDTSDNSDLVDDGTGGRDTGNSADINDGSSAPRISCKAETCTDRSTGLAWQRCCSGLHGNDCSEGTATRKVWQAAVSDCTELVLANKDDWRLPNIYELISIVDFSKVDPAIDPNYFPNTRSNAVWSSTDVLRPAQNGGASAWGIQFANGVVGYEQKGTNLIPLNRAEYYIRCVRGPELGARTFTKKDLVVRDDASSLMWQRCSAGQAPANCDDTAKRYSWQEAKDYCEALENYANYSDWRLPNIRELLSLANYEKADPAVDTDAFPKTQSAVYWSSTPIEGHPNHAWYVDFESGHTNFEQSTLIGIINTGIINTDAAHVNQSYFVRCVRGKS